MKIRNKPYNLLLLTGLLFVVSSFILFDQSSTIDIHLHDTYFIVAHKQIFWLLAVLAFIIWIIYLSISSLLYSKTLMWIHIYITIISLIFIGLSLFFDESIFNPTPRSYYDFSDWNSSGVSEAFSKISNVSIIVLLLVQIVFIVNFLLRMLKPKVR